MGTRVLYQIMGEINGEKRPVCILYSNSSHPTEDPEITFRVIAESVIGPTTAVELLLAERYENAGGHHEPGDRMFSIVTTPFGDYEYSLAIDYDADEPQVYMIERDAEPALKM